MLALYYASLTVVPFRLVQSPLIIIVGLCFVYFFCHNVQTLADLRASFLLWPCQRLMGVGAILLDTFYSHISNAHIPAPSPFS